MFTGPKTFRVLTQHWITPAPFSSREISRFWDLRVRPGPDANVKGVPEITPSEPKKIIRALQKDKKTRSRFLLRPWSRISRRKVPARTLCTFLKKRPCQSFRFRIPTIQTTAAAVPTAATGTTGSTGAPVGGGPSGWNSTVVVAKSSFWYRSRSTGDETT